MDAGAGAVGALAAVKDGLLVVNGAVAYSSGRKDLSESVLRRLRMYAGPLRCCCCCCCNRRDSVGSLTAAEWYGRESVRRRLKLSEGSGCDGRLRLGGCGRERPGVALGDVPFGSCP